MTGAARRRPAPWPRRLRAVWRLAACTLHGLHALAVAVFLFPRLDAAGRQARIRWWGVTMLRRLDVALDLRGNFSSGGCLLVANHVSWLDILAIHSVCPQARFVSKADVKTWPLLARVIEAGDTLYLERERMRDALRVVKRVGEALAAGATVVVFPEGTTGDGRVLLPFHANLLQAAVDGSSLVQPVALHYSDADDGRSRAVEYVGATTLARSMWKVALADRLTVHLRPLPAERAVAVNRRLLATRLRAQIAAAIDQEASDDAATDLSPIGDTASSEAAVREAAAVRASGLGE